MNTWIRVVRGLLFPLACLYAGVTAIRNWLYDKGVLESHSFPIPVICVGNLTVGGTGKTPHTEYLIRLLKDDYRVSTLSRGYGRKTRGFRWAAPESTAQQIGDEPIQFYRKFGSEISVAVGEDRVAAIKKIITAPEGGVLKVPSFGGDLGEAAPPSGVGGLFEIILLDDAFQHRAVKPSLSILLTDYNRLFYRDFLLPTGNLRETRRGARRADIIVVSKCPDKLPELEQRKITNSIQAYARPATPVFFTGIRYGQPVGFALPKDTIFSDRLLLVSGIAQSGNLENYVRQTFACQGHLDFKDHHEYTPADIEKIERACRKAGVTTVLTTEKDYVKLIQWSLPTDLSFYYLPIEIYFLFHEQEKFNQLTIHHSTAI